MAKAIFERAEKPMYRVTAIDGGLRLKRCSICGTVKPVDTFHKDKSRPYGLAARCKVCDNKNRAARYRAANPTFTPMSTETRARNQRAQERAYRERMVSRTEAEVIRDRARLRPDDTKVCAICKVLRPVEEFFGSIREGDGLEAHCKMCSIAKQLRVSLTALLERWADLDLYGCVYCGAEYEDVDHVIPRSQGGTNHVENLVPACRSCNRGVGGKFARTPAQWRTEDHAAIRAAIAATR